MRYDAGAGSRELVVARWGLIPYWAKDIKIGYSSFNARCEDVESKPAFRDAFKRRRRLIPLDNSYKWKKLGPKEKQPYVIARRTNGDGRAIGDVVIPGQGDDPQRHDHHLSAE